MNSIEQILNDVKGLKEREARLRALLQAADLDRSKGSTIPPRPVRSMETGRQSKPGTGG